jgi:acyl-CoA synthetase (AMP-forming)/AMP-acid ligase II
VDASLTVGRRFRRIVSEYPDRVALFADDTQLTYDDLGLLTSTFARLFRDALNLSPGQVLLAWLNNCPEFVAGFLASAETGAIFVPLNINWRPPELRWLLSRLPIAGVLTKQALRAPWDELSDLVAPDRVLCIDDQTIQAGCRPASRESLTAELEAGAQPDQPVAYLCTSGSTGMPKIVPRTHRNLLEHVAAIGCALDLTPGLRFLSVVPFYHGNGLDNGLLLALFSGATVFLQPQFTVARFVKALADHHIQMLPGSPAIFEILARSELDADCFSSLRICTSSGGPLAEQISETIQQRLRFIIRHVYGSSETGVIAVAPPQGGPRLIPVSNVVVKILDSSGRSLPRGAEGEVAVKGPAVAAGYIDDHEATARFFRDGYYCTGDIGRIDSAGYLQLLGRIRPLINLSGTKVDPVEVENAILALPAVNTCKVFAQSGQHHNQVLKAVIAVREGSALNRLEVVAHCRQFLAEYKIPRIMEFVSQLSEDLTGKGSRAMR